LAAPPGHAWPARGFFVGLSVWGLWWHTDVMSTIRQLASKQLEAYNASDLDAFVACYHATVQVYEAGELVCEGHEAFRASYLRLFTTMEFGATVSERMGNASHCIDLEDYWRIDPDTQERTEGTILVHYTEKEGLIGMVRFWR
jgi:hypothetical protein